MSTLPPLPYMSIHAPGALTFQETVESPRLPSHFSITPKASRTISLPTMLPSSLQKYRDELARVHNSPVGSRQWENPRKTLASIRDNVSLTIAAKARSQEMEQLHHREKLAAPHARPELWEPQQVKQRMLRVLNRDPLQSARLQNYQAHILSPLNSNSKSVQEMALPTNVQATVTNATHESSIFTAAAQNAVKPTFVPIRPQFEPALHTRLASLDRSQKPDPQNYMAKTHKAAFDLQISCGSVSREELLAADIFHENKGEIHEGTSGSEGSGTDGKYRAEEPKAQAADVSSLVVDNQKLAASSLNPLITQSPFAVSSAQSPCRASFLCSDGINNSSFLLQILEVQPCSNVSPGVAEGVTETGIHLMGSHQWSDEAVDRSRIVSGLREIPPLPVINCYSSDLGLMSESLKSQGLQHHEGLLESSLDVDKIVEAAGPREWEINSISYGKADIIREKLRDTRSVVIERNPAAFKEEIASQAEARQLELADKARQKYQSLSQHESQIRSDDPFMKAISKLQVERPYFMPPVYQKIRVQRARTEAVVVREEKKKWNVYQSIFADRQRDSDSHDVFDSKQARMSQFHVDWSHLSSKPRFQKMLGFYADVKGRSDKLQRQLEAIREEVSKYQNELRSIFQYYSMVTRPMQSSFIMNMGMNEWMVFCNENGIVDTQRGGTMTDFQNVFFAANFDAEKRDADSGEEEGVLRRFEFIESVIRSAFGKFISSGQVKDTREAISAFVQGVVFKQLPHLEDMLLDPNDFRQKRFYTEEMAEEVTKHKPFLMAIFKYYKAGHRTKYFQIEHWATLLEKTGLLVPKGVVERRDAKLLFGWSQMLVTDELKRRKRTTGLLFYDFVEALARLADWRSLPPVEALLHREDGVEHPLLECLRERKASGEQVVTDTLMPLSFRFNCLMHFLMECHQKDFGVKDLDECIAKMMKLSNMMGGGFERG
ncbi:hypothetical protein CEUSTIGMA_g3191.t1 [Chlamydomonas eustigma]|uniref:Uncharacterized protein n=1 Tax=Chlamydomonas eustigma TaxID=1157962 RepID=A0A250WY20_9CHLO|nr:hypothetical protein CEUSTIGMA_g3191.t1 [Chlamydomonas eustigma]|eukprot:GAX75748.1 hypothetical protein CEUSTIGMA_g3191.t1 [Chlamydomonas eustigma]